MPNVLLSSSRSSDTPHETPPNVVGSIMPVDPRDVMIALGWFYENRPQLEVLHVFLHRGVIHAEATLRHPGIGDPPDVEIWRRRDDLSFENVACQQASA